MSFKAKEPVYFLADTVARLALAGNANRRYLSIENRGQGLVSFKLGSQFQASETEVQQITFSKPPVAGSFSLIYAGQETIELDMASTTNTEVQAALEALPAIGMGNVQVDGGFLDENGLTVTFIGALANTGVEPLLVNIDGLLTAAQDQQQRILFSPGVDGGTFTLSDGVTTSPPLPFDISNDDLKAALNAFLGKIGWVSALSGAADDRLVTFGGEGFEHHNYPLLRAVSSLTRSVAEATEVGVLRATPAPVVGTYKLRVLGKTTAALDFDATDSEVQAALEALSTVGAGNVGVAGASLADGFTINFLNDLSGVDLTLAPVNINLGLEDMGPGAEEKQASEVRLDFNVTTQGAGAGAGTITVSQAQAAVEAEHVVITLVTLTDGHVQHIEGADIQPTEFRTFEDGEAPIDSIWVLATEPTEVNIIEGE